MKYWVKPVYTGYFVCFAFSLKNYSVFIMLMFILISKQRSITCSIFEIISPYFHFFGILVNSIRDSSILKTLNFKLENIFLNLQITFSIWNVQNPYVLEQSTFPYYLWQRASFIYQPFLQHKLQTSCSAWSQKMNS